MSAIAVTVASNVTTALNAGVAAEEFSASFTAVREALPRWQVKELQTLRVSVVPAGMDREPQGRGRDQADLDIWIAVQKHVSSPTNAQLDPLLELMQEIANYMSRRSFSGALWRRTENSPLYLPDHLEQLHVFTSVVTVSYRVEFA